MDALWAQLVGGPYDGTVVTLPPTDDLLVESHWYESVDRWTEYQGQRARVYAHEVDCCGMGSADDLW